MGSVAIRSIVAAGIPAIMEWGNNSTMRDVVIPGLGHGDSPRKKR